ncbi:MAG: aldehyde dehydrogenase family protein, partial [Bacteroidetes bacterium]|nr:aldehyde dehydrogenase family protein [Bacteroidota bacterium]
GKTRSVEFRLEQLKRFERALKANEQLLLDAIFADLKKSRYDTFTSELSLVYRELSFMIKNVRKWSKKQRVQTNLLNFPARSYRLAEPRGVTYIAGAWNYPYQLTLLPLVDSLAAGNTAIVKPSEVAPHTSSAMAKIINDTFAPEYCFAAEGGAEKAQEILAQKFDYIFFTGGTKIGQVVYEAAAKHMTPVTLELGGKNPAFVLPDCDIPTCAKRIVWAKLLNAGQTCVAVDYLLVHSSVEERLLKEMRSVMEKHYPANGVSDNFMSIVNERHTERIGKLIDPKKVYYGGVVDTKNNFISPTILHNVTFDDEIMKEEIFGPVLPVVRYDDLNDAMKLVRQFPKPLSLYVFGSNNEEKERLFGELSFGGGSQNDAVMYFANDHLPLGGVGASGIGAYHGEEGFKTFSHYKSIMEKATWLEFWFLKTPPYSEWKLKILRLLIEKL